MADVRSFLDNLKNLRLVTFVALDHVRENRDQFVKDATGSQIQEFETHISQIRTLAEQLEKEFNSVEDVISKHPPVSGSVKNG